MATIKRVRRLANPFKRRRRTVKRNVAKRRRKYSAKQIKYFGTKRQRAALRKKRSVKANPRRRRTVRNPAIVLTLGAVNPHTKGTSMRRKKRNARRRRVTAPVVHRRRRRRAVVANPRRRRVHNRRRRANPRRYRRNPQPFTKGNAMMVAGGLVGVTATKIIAKFIPASLLASLGTFGPVVANGLAAVAAGLAAQKFSPGQFGDGVMFGGLMQAGSALINSVAPNLRIADYPIALQGMGELVPGQFVVPQNPLRIAAPPTQARVTVNGLQRAFGTAF